MREAPQGTGQQPDAADTPLAIKRLCAATKDLREQFKALQRRLAEAERHVGLDSCSGGKPPAAPNGDDRGHPGKQPGHEGAMLQQPSVPNQVETLPTGVCDAPTNRVPEQGLREPDAGRLAWPVGRIAFLLYTPIYSLIYRVGPFVVPFVVCVALVLFLNTYFIVGHTGLGQNLEQIALGIRELLSKPIGKTIAILLSLLSGYFANRLLNSYFDSFGEFRKKTSKLKCIYKKWEKRLDEISARTNGRKVGVDEVDSRPSRLLQEDAKSPKRLRDTDEQSTPPPEESDESDNLIGKIKDHFFDLLKYICRHAWFWIAAPALFPPSGYTKNSCIHHQNAGSSCAGSSRAGSSRAGSSRAGSSRAGSGGRAERGGGGLLVLFGTAQLDHNSFETPKFTKSSSGIKLDPGSEAQLRAFLREPSNSGSDVKLAVVGFASATQITVQGEKSLDPNVCVANLRAEAVVDFLRKEQASLKVCRVVWNDYDSLKRCRPYREPESEPEDPAHVPLERMNQSVRLYVVKGEETNDFCNGGDPSLKSPPCVTAQIPSCSELPSRYPLER